MLEIILLLRFSNKITKMMKKKGRGAAGYVALFIFLWFAGEFVGAIVGAILLAIFKPTGSDGGHLLFIYLFALIGAIIGGVTGTVIANLVPPIESRSWMGYHDTEDDPPLRGSGKETSAQDESIQDRPGLPPHWER